jgi:ectoine hydroxylase-related dioxygenase (phytanoyl-CoA dioxygenase family)
MVTLTEDQVETYHDQGYVVVEELFDEETVAELRAEADRILELLVNATLATGRQSGRLVVAADDDGEQLVREVVPMMDLSRPYARIEGELREAVGQLLDDEAVLMEEKLNYKQPLPEPVPELEAIRASSSFPVHNDWAYFRAQGYPSSVLSSMVMVDDSTADRGPLHVWPDTHHEHRPHEEVEGMGLQIPADEVEGTGHDVIAPAGSVIFFSSLLVHSSRPNASEHPRRMMIYSHYPDSEADVAFDERNGPRRFEESPWEWEYQRRRDAGEFTDRFEAPEL